MRLNQFIPCRVRPGHRVFQGHIDRVARFLGRPVSRISLDREIGSAALFRDLEDAIWHNDAPVGSLSNLAHRRLMAAARERGIRVILSGQGADELLCGYKKYLGFYLQQLARDGRLDMALGVAWRFWRNGTVLWSGPMTRLQSDPPTAANVRAVSTAASTPAW